MIQPGSIQEIRAGIDDLDDQIVHLIAMRSDYVKQAAKFKTSEKAVRDEERVNSVIASKIALAKKYNVDPELIGILYKVMINFFVNKELEEWKLIDEN